MSILKNQLFLGAAILVSGTIFFHTMYGKYYRPWRYKQNLLEAAEAADYLLSKEYKTEIETESDTY